MGVDVVALVHCPDPERLAALSDASFETLADQLHAIKGHIARGEQPRILVALSVLGKGRDHARVFTGIRWREIENDPVFAQMLAHRIAGMLPPGTLEGDIAFSPDVAEPRARTHAAMLAELGDAAIIASVAPVPEDVRREWQLRRDAKLEEQRLALQRGVPAEPPGWKEARAKIADDLAGIFTVPDGAPAFKSTALPPISIEKAKELAARHPGALAALEKKALRLIAKPAMKTPKKRP